jgi:hypothetical protein
MLQFLMLWRFQQKLFHIALIGLYPEQHKKWDLALPCNNFFKCRLESEPWPLSFNFAFELFKSESAIYGKRSKKLEDKVTEGYLNK